tara:strand:+ start:6952 stop:7470 length:519 start_codon:yes stop_codon:yes gene_type:complete
MLNYSEISENGMQLGNANTLARPTYFPSKESKVDGTGCAGTKSNVVAATGTYEPYNMKGGKKRRVSRRHRRSTKHRRHRTKHHRHRRRHRTKHRRSTKHHRRKSPRRRKTRRLHGGALHESLNQKSTLLIDSKGYGLGAPLHSGKPIEDASALANPPPIHVYESCPKQLTSR